MPRGKIVLRERTKIIVLLLIGLVLSLFVVGRLETGVREQLLEAGKQALERFDREGSVLPMEGKVMVILRRSFVPLVWIGLSFTVWGTVSLYLAWAYVGFSAGHLLWLVISLQGWRGPFVIWALLFPQYLCYLPALLLLYIGCLRWWEFRREYVVPREMMVRTPEFRLYLVRILLGILLYGAGIWTEIRWNPQVYEKIFTIS